LVEEIAQKKEVYFCILDLVCDWCVGGGEPSLESEKATSSDPCQLGPWFRIVFVRMRLFCRWSNGGQML
jgi:hypothetical protein